MTKSEHRVSPSAGMPSASWADFDRLFGWANRTRRLNLLVWLGVGTLISLLLTVVVVQNGAVTTARTWIGVLFILDLIFVLSFAAVLSLEIYRIIRRDQIIGTLQRRLITFFILMALVPTVFVAFFSTLTFNYGLEGWFSSQVHNTVNASYETALAYQKEHYELLTRDGQAITDALINETSTSITPDYSAGNLRKILNQAVNKSINISHAFIINGNGQIYTRGEKSYRFNYIAPTVAQMEQAYAGKPVIIEDRENNQFRYLRYIEGLGFDRYLYLTRPVDGSILALLDQTEQTAQFYQDLEKGRLRLTVMFASVFLLVALIVLLLAIWAAMFLSKRLTRPISQIVRAVTRMSAGELDVRVPVSDDQSEFTVLSKSFNEMTADVRAKQQELRAAGAASERESQRFNSVLEGVSSGVIGISKKGKITFINRAARAILKIPPDETLTKIDSIVPEFGALIEATEHSKNDEMQDQIIVTRGGYHETLFVRVAKRDQFGGMIISFDDVSDLVQAQRMAAWGDVARRIAHEIKNPLTPIRLSAERMQRRYSQTINDPKFDDMTDIIVRKTEDLRKIVDEFARFSRMPDPVIKEGNLAQSLRDAIMLQSQNDKVKFNSDIPKEVVADYDETLIGQAFGNILKNAIESMETIRLTDKDFSPQIDVIGDLEGDEFQIVIEDNGMGWPENKARLFEPYVTFKDEGTGLGLPIVKKIVEDHGGSMALIDRKDGIRGAAVLITLPIKTRANKKSEQAKK